jgi:hypothetical protein
MIDIGAVHCKEYEVHADQPNRLSLPKPLAVSIIWVNMGNLMRGCFFLPP